MVQVYCMTIQPFHLLVGISAHGISISFAIVKHSVFVGGGGLKEIYLRRRKILLHLPVIPGELF